MKIGVYVLFSEKDKRTYIGSTGDLDRRLREHKSGKVISTKNRLPVKLIYFELCSKIGDARKREKYYKSCSGRIKLRAIIKSLLEVQVPRLDSQANASRSGSRRHS